MVELKEWNGITLVREVINFGEGFQLLNITLMLMMELKRHQKLIERKLKGEIEGVDGVLLLVEWL